MKPKADAASLRAKQSTLIGDSHAPLLLDFIDKSHPLALLADRIDWSSFEPHWDKHFGNADGPHASSARLVAGLLMLKHMEALSDERLVATWVRDPYMQYFCGETHFRHDPPIYPSTLGRWRKKLGEEGMEYLLSTVLNSAIKMGALKAQSCAHVCVDSTVMEKNITWPTDSKLLVKVLNQMVRLMQKQGLSIRQSYSRTAARMAQQIARYAHAKQFKRMRRLLKALQTRVGRVMRELKRQLTHLDELTRAQAEQLIAQAQQIIAQAANPKLKHKLYSLHEEDVDCISKGKARQRYEFGVKVGITTTQKEGFVLGMRSYPGNPYDGHTLDDLLQQATTISAVEIKTVAVDLGYRGRHDTKAKVIHRGRQLSKREKRRLRRRSGLEAMIGHMKQDGLLDRCPLKGKEGDAIHALLCGIGHNLRLMMNFLREQLREVKLGVILSMLRRLLSVLVLMRGYELAVA